MKCSAMLIILEGETRLTVCVGHTLMVFCTVLWLVQLIGRKEAFAVMQEQVQFGVGTPLHAAIWLSEQLMPLWLCTSVSKYLQSQKFKLWTICLGFVAPRPHKIEPLRVSHIVVAKYAILQSCSTKCENANREMCQNMWPANCHFY